MHDAFVILLAFLLLHVVMAFGMPLWPRQLGSRPSILRSLAKTLACLIVILGIFLRNDLLGWPAAAEAFLAAVAWGLLDYFSPSKAGQSVKGFIVVQALQIVVLVMLWMFVEHRWEDLPGLMSALWNPRALAYLLGYVLVMRPASELIAKVLEHWTTTANANSSSLQKAGALIGYLERTLILTFVLLKRWEAIGFLLAAKSILRFNESNGGDQRPSSEYVLVGTLVSVSICIAVGLLLNALLAWWSPAAHAETSLSSLKKLFLAM
ncbi:MAG: hypothetical protein V4801_25790 [Burkholderia gladioli]